MLKIKPVCENCGKSLPNNSIEAMICSFECTFCLECVSEKLDNVCPNCGGGLQKRPTRPLAMLDKYPVSTIAETKTLNFEKFQELKTKYSNIHPRKR